MEDGRWRPGLPAHLRQPEAVARQSSGQRQLRTERKEQWRYLLHPRPLSQVQESASQVFGSHPKLQEQLGGPARLPPAHKHGSLQVSARYFVRYLRPKPTDSSMEYYCMVQCMVHGRAACTANRPAKPVDSKSTPASSARRDKKIAISTDDVHVPCKYLKGSASKAAFNWHLRLSRAPEHPSPMQAKQAPECQGGMGKDPCPRHEVVAGWSSFTSATQHQTPAHSLRYQRCKKHRGRPTLQCLYPKASNKHVCL